MEDEKFRTLFNQLCNLPYQAHWWTRVPVDQVLSGSSSDCSDRAYVLADYCEKHQIPYSFILTLFTQPISLHMALVIDGQVYDPMWPAYAMPVGEYKSFVGGSWSRVFGPWIQKIIP